VHIALDFCEVGWFQPKAFCRRPYWAQWAWWMASECCIGWK